MNFENAIVVINKTRLESLIERFNTRDQARFYIQHSGGEFEDYELEHETFHTSLDTVTSFLQQQLNVKVVERKFMPNFLFSEKDMVVVLGQDGLVANAAKYVHGLPILAVNPDSNRYDGILLPFNMKTFEWGCQNLVRQTATLKEVTLAEARTNDGQHLLAFNDLFIGPASHTSARYRITHLGDSEDQSSSGIIVSTGAGSTGWLSSVMNMTNGVAGTFAKGPQKSRVSCALPWNTSRLAFVVREPFQCKYSSVNIVAGTIRRDEKLVVESYMPSNGIVFSDGVEADFIKFNSGTKVEIGVSEEKAWLVLNTK